MGVYLDKQASRIDYNHKEFILDTIADLDSIIAESCSPGSTCFIIETSSVYMLDNNKEWKEI